MAVLSAAAGPAGPDAQSTIQFLQIFFLLPLRAHIKTATKWYIVLCGLSSVVPRCSHGVTRHYKPMQGP